MALRRAWGEEGEGMSRPWEEVSACVYQGREDGRMGEEVTTEERRVRKQRGLEESRGE